MIHHHHHHHIGGGKGGAEEAVVNIERDKANVKKCLQLVKMGSGHRGVQSTNLATIWQLKTIFNKY